MSHKDKDHKEERSNKCCNTAVLEAFLYNVVFSKNFPSFPVVTSESSHSSRRVSFIIPFQLSPVAILNKVRYAIPNDLK